jgi:hypothetical protein
VNKKYIAKTVALTATQVEVIDLAKHHMEKTIGVTLSYSQAITIAAKYYAAQERA